MADEKWLEIELEDESAIMARFDRFVERQQHRARRFVDDLADSATHIIHRNVPVYSTYTQRHVDRSAVRFLPGGAGGGGSYQAVAGIKRGTSLHPLYAEQGTGLYGRHAAYITPVSAPYMRFYSVRYSRWISRTRIRGQKGQRYFYQSWRELNLYAQSRLLATATI